MGKFDGYLICTDLDDTLLTSDKKISDENMKAIEYFKNEGGLFTFATGRIPQSTGQYVELAKPNAPVIVYNGGGIYDWKNKKFLFRTDLEPGASEVIKYITSQFDFAGVEIVTVDDLYICKENFRVKEHAAIEKVNYIYAEPDDVPEPWIKILFMQERDEIGRVREALDNSDFSKKYSFVQSAPWYYEILPKNSSKGAAGLKLCEILGIDKLRFIAIGDNENDIEMISYAAIGAAVENASDKVKSYADIIAPHHNKDAIAWLINEIEKRTEN